MPTTAIMTCALKPGSAIGDADNEAWAVLRNVHQTLRQADGCQRIHFGMQVERPHVLQMTIDWGSTDDYRTFMEQTYYPSFLNRLMAVSDSAPVVWHARLQPEGALHRTLSAPVTEVATFYFDGQPAEGYLERALQFVDAVEKGRPQGCLGAAVGITHEEIEREGVRGRGAVLTIGWSSVDAHLQFRETALFTDNIHLLRRGPGSIEIHHVHFRTWAADQGS